MLQFVHLMNQGGDNVFGRDGQLLFDLCDQIFHPGAPKFLRAALGRYFRSAREVALFKDIQAGSKGVFTNLYATGNSPGLDVYVERGADGGTQAVTPIAVRGLVDPASGLGTAANPAPMAATMACSTK